MFDSLIRNAQSAVETSFEHILLKVIVIVPFVVAGGFGTASLALWLYERFPAIEANLIMGAAFLSLSAILAIALNVKSVSPRKPDHVAIAGDGPSQGPKEDPSVSQPISSADTELLASAVSLLGPIAAPRVIGLVMRNLPIVLALGVAAFVMTRDTSAEAPASDRSSVPAE